MTLDLRRALDWHEQPGVVAWAATGLGRLALWAAAHFRVTSLAFLS